MFFFDSTLDKLELSFLQGFANSFKNVTDFGGIVAALIKAMAPKPEDKMAVVRLYSVQESYLVQARLGEKMTQNL